MEDHNTRKDIRKRQVTLINAYPLGTGIGEYVRDLMKINSIEVISLIFNQNTMKNFSYPGVIKIGRFPHFQNKFDFLLNAYFQRLSFSRVFKSLNDRTLKQNIVHYADPSISPATNFDLSLVTIHDTIFFDKTLAGGGPFNLRFRYVIKNLKIYKQFENIITISNKVKNMVS